MHHWMEKFGIKLDGSGTKHNSSILMNTPNIVNLITVDTTKQHTPKRATSVSRYSKKASTTLNLSFFLFRKWDTSSKHYYKACPLGLKSTPESKILIAQNLNLNYRFPHSKNQLTNLLTPFQITLWDYVRYGVNDFLGETVVDLHSHPLDDEPEWYMLQPHQESNYPGGVRTKKLSILLPS